MNKRGISHVEVLLSFLVFMGFVIFALYFFSPLQSSRLVDSSLSYAFREVKQNAVSEIEVYSVLIPSEVKNEIGKSIKAIVGDAANPSDNEKVRVEHKNGAVNAKEENGEVIFEIANDFFNSDNGFAEIKFGEDFDEPELPSDQLVSENADVISSNVLKLVSEKKIRDLESVYENDYVGLKNRFNLPSRINFGFKLEFENDEVEADKNKPEGVEVFVKSERVEVLRIDGNTEFADLIVKIW